METAKTRGQREHLRQAFRVRLISLKNVHDIRALNVFNLFFHWQDFLVLRYLFFSRWQDFLVLTNQ